MRRLNATLSRLSWSPEALPLDLDAVKLQRRVSGSSLDRLFEDWILAAASYFEEQTGRQLISAPWEYRIDEFPASRYIELPKPPLQTVVSVVYNDGSDTAQVLSTDDYDVIAPAGDYCAPGRVVLKSGASWPTTDTTEGAVTVTFTAGYGDTPEDLPGLVRAVLMLLVGHFHKYGEAAIGGLEANSLSEIPLGVDTMMRAFKWSATPRQRPWDVTWLV